MPRSARTPWLAKEPNQHVWYINWYDQAAKRYRRCSSGTCDREKAEEALGKFIIERANTSEPSSIEPPERHLIATALRWYLEERGEKLASAAFAARTVERLIGFFGPRATVSNITPQVIRRYERSRVRKVRVYETKQGRKVVEDKRPVSPAMIRRELVVLSAALHHALDNGRLTSVPKIPMPAVESHRTRYLERDEIERLIANCVEPHIKLFVTLAINTGARKGALLEMRWSQVDFTNRIVYLNPEGRIQTHKRRAIVPMNDVLCDVLRKMKRQREVEAEEMSLETNQLIKPCDYVVAYRNAQVANIRTGFRMACERAGITGVTPHTLRHTAGTLMALAGIDLFLIAKVLGHSVQKTTELYAHFRPDYLRGAVDVLGKATPDAFAHQKQNAIQPAETFH